MTDAPIIPEFLRRTPQKGHDMTQTPAAPTRKRRQGAYVAVLKVFYPLSTLTMPKP